MRAVITLAIVSVCASVAEAQVKEERRFDVRLNTEIYPQAKAKDALRSLIHAIDRDRFDYIVAHLLEPGYVDEQLRITAPHFDRLAAAQVAKEDLVRKGFAPDFIRKRRGDLAFQANFENLIYRVKNKLANDPEAEKELRKLAREGEFQEGVDAATAKYKDIKDRTVFFKNINGRWFIENKMTE